MFIKCSVLVLAFFASTDCYTVSHSSSTSNEEAQRKAAPGSRPIVKSPGQGGKGGDTFDDLKLLNFTRVSIVGIRAINISFEDQVSGIQVSYLLSNRSTWTGPLHGKISKPPVSILLRANEYVSRISGKTNGDLVDQLTITTVGPTEYEHRTYGPFGNDAKNPFVFDGYVLGFHGRSGDLLDNIGVYSIDSLKKSPEFGRNVGSKGNFDDKLNLGVPPVVGLSKLHVWHNSLIPAVQFEYRLLGGGTRLGDRHGTEFAAGNLTTITFDKGEQLVELRGKTGAQYFDYLDQLSFTTVKEGGVYAKYGPFGKLGTVNFLFQGNLYGFFGSAGSYVFGLGAYYT